MRSMHSQTQQRCREVTAHIIGRLENVAKATIANGTTQTSTRIVKVGKAVVVLIAEDTVMIVETDDEAVATDRLTDAEAVAVHFTVITPLIDAVHRTDGVHHTDTVHQADRTTDAIHHRDVAHQVAAHLAQDLPQAVMAPNHRGTLSAT